MPVASCLRTIRAFGVRAPTNMSRVQAACLEAFAAGAKPAHRRPGAAAPEVSAAVVRHALGEPIRPLTRTGVAWVLWVVAGAAAAQTAPRPLRLNADLLARYDQVMGGPDFYRGRVWARPGFEVTPGPRVRFGARGSFAKGSHPNRLSIRRFDNFHENEAALDRLYVVLNGKGLEVSAGKFAMPLAVSEMIWDRDIQPSGVAVGWGRAGVTLRGVVFQRSHIHHDRSTVVGAEAGVRRKGVEWSGGYLGFHGLDQFQPGMERQNRARVDQGRLRYEARF